jgi:hypothetical protein
LIERCVKEDAAARRKFQRQYGAIIFYREALSHDPAYAPAAINLGCALIVRGLHAEARGLNTDFSEAVTTLLRAIERPRDQGWQ